MTHPWMGGIVRPSPWVPDPAEHYRSPRTITQLCGSAEGLFSLCNDGSVWQLIGGVWCPEPGIPQRQVAEGEL